MEANKRGTGQQQAIQRLASSGDAQKLMAMLRQTGQVEQAAQAAAEGQTGELMDLMKRLMATQEGAQLVERISRQAKEQGLS